MHPGPLAPVRRYSRWKDATERCWAYGADRVGRFVPEVPQHTVGRICSHAQPFPRHRHHFGCRGTPRGCPKQGRHKAEGRHKACPYVGGYRRCVLGCIREYIVNNPIIPIAVSKATNAWIAGQPRWPLEPGYGNYLSRLRLMRLSFYPT